MEDATRFLLESRSAIEEAPLQVYSSALIFSPKRSQVKSLFQGRIPRWIKTLPEVPVDWGPSLQSLEGHSGGVTAVAFSSDGHRLASASLDSAVRLWDSSTGASCGILEGHSDWVTAVAFSSDGHCYASTSIERARFCNIKTVIDTQVRTTGVIYAWQFLQITLRMAMLGLLRSSQSQQLSSTSLLLHVGEKWIFWRGDRMVWLPSEYRPRSLATQNNILALGHESGRVTFDPNHMPVEETA